jgi:hypothetical protein
VLFIAKIDYQASDLGDPTGIIYRLEIFVKEGNASIRHLKTVETFQPVYELDLSQNSHFTVKVTAFEREMNKTAELSSPIQPVKQISTMEWLVASPLAWLAVILATALALIAIIIYSPTTLYTGGYL